MSLFPSILSSLDKKQVAHSFSRAAQAYDRVAELQPRVAEHLLNKIQLRPRVSADDYVCDLGVGTGYAIPQLLTRLEPAQVLALDLAEGMLHICRQRYAEQGVRSICADAEALPLATASQSLLFSSLAIQWCPHPERLLKEIARVLKPGACAYLATLGPDSLYELRDAWAALDDQPHVNRFLSDQDWLSCLPMGLETLELELRQEVLYYPDLLALMRSLKDLGASPVAGRQASGLGGRARLQALADLYEGYRQAQGLPLTYQTYYWVLKRV